MEREGFYFFDFTRPREPKLVKPILLKMCRGFPRLLVTYQNKL